MLKGDVVTLQDVKIFLKLLQDWGMLPLTLDTAAEAKLLLEFQARYGKLSDKEKEYMNVLLESYPEIFEKTGQIVGPIDTPAELNAALRFKQLTGLIMGPIDTIVESKLLHVLDIIHRRKINPDAFNERDCAPNDP